MEVEFKVDTKERKQWFTAESFAHPAKMSLPLELWLIEKYTKPGDVILDPMAGIGTILVGATLGRNIICVELEEKFCWMMFDNAEKIMQRGPQMGCKMGRVDIIQGDARNLEGLLVDKIITSPPYAEAQSGGGIAKKGYQGSKHSPTDLIGKRSYMPENIGDDNNISNLTYGNIDAVITSPPYEDSLSEPEDRKHSIDQSKWGDGRKIAPPHSQVHLTYPSSSSNNIGNLKSQSYLSAMLLVYQQCHKVLKPNGLMILVTKNFIRNKQVIRLDLDTIKLCEQVGFKLTEQHKRKLPSQSFWRIIYYQKHPEVEKINHEDILVFVK